MREGVVFIEASKSRWRWWGQGNGVPVGDAIVLSRMRIVDVIGGGSVVTQAQKKKRSATLKHEHDPTHDDDFEEKIPAPPWMMYLGVVGAVLLIFGTVTWLLGLGPFAYRQIFYGTSEIYILNMTEREVMVSIDKGSQTKIPPRSKERTPILGGTTVIRTETADGELIEEVEVFVDGNPVFYNVEGERCMVLSDISGFYLGDPSNGVKVQEKYKKGTRIMHLPHDRMVWPRQTLRDEVKGAELGVAWIELVGCPLLDEDQSDILEGHLSVMLTERKKEEQNLKKLREMQRKLREGGSEAIDKAYGPGAKNKKKDKDAPDAGTTEAAP